MKSAWIPTEGRYIEDAEGIIRTIVFIDNRGQYPNGKIGIDQYYDANHAIFSLLPQTTIEAMPGYENGVDAEEAVNLYNTVFNK